MPYYYQRWRRKRRYRWPRRWRTRGPFRRRYRRRFWVRSKRKRKLPKLTLREWQPEKINKVTVKGLYPLFLCNKERINNNMIQWLDSVAPHDFPGGGGFSIMQFTLQALYEEFIKGRNWWTRSNCMLPLIRYRYVTLKLYRAEKFDYIVHIHRCYPLKATDELYMSTQPGIMGLTRKAIHVPCRSNSANKKPYKRVRVKPPTQMQTGWHFQKDIATFPLLILTASATSFDRYFLASNSISTTIGFHSLNTRIFQLHDWQGYPTTGYKPNSNMYFWGTKTGENNPALQNLIYLGGTGKLEEGTEVNGNYNNYATTPGLWGNIFHPEYLTKTNYVFKTTKPPNEIVNYIKIHETAKVEEYNEISLFTDSFLVECRYNPFNDKSTENKTYIVSNLNDHTAWQPPPDKPQVLRENLPLWLSTWGYLDFIRKANIVSQPDINYITVLQSNFITSTPKLQYYVPIDDNFISEPPSSPYQNALNAADTLHFYPKINFQVKSLNLLGSTGPGTIKLQNNQSCEAHIEYMFHFKLGGCPAPMDKLCDPTEQPKYPIPNYKQQTPSLQSPTEAIQTFLYNFDERRGMLTKKAAKRIKKDYGTEKDFVQITGNAMDLPTPYQGPPSEDETSSEEEETETTFKLLKLRYKQQQLRKRILNIISQQHLE
nr:MAG: ORF1 [TTV-like mini virus]